MDKKSKQYYIGAAVMFLFSFILPSFVSPWAEGITDAGVTIVLIFVGTIIGLIATNDCILAALFSMCAPWSIAASLNRQASSALLSETRWYGRS